MYVGIIITACISTILRTISAQTTVCPACDALMGRWTPDSDTGLCLGNISDPVKYILNFEQCICSSGSQSDYAACASCNINGDGGVPIDGLNFGPASAFRSACSLFAYDVTSILKPSGLNAFASVVAPINTASHTKASSRDILGLYIFQNVVTATNAIVSGILTDSLIPGTTAAATAATTLAASNVLSTGTSTTANATGSASGISEAGKSQMPFAGLTAMLIVSIFIASFV